MTEMNIEKCFAEYEKVHNEEYGAFAVGFRYFDGEGEQAP